MDDLIVYSFDESYLDMGVLNIDFIEGIFEEDVFVM